MSSSVFIIGGIGKLGYKIICHGKTYKYFPDFITDDGIFEIKGYYSDKSKSKHMQHPDIKMIFSEDMKIYLDYVIEKYGRNFIKLYE